jgi:type I restriction enzyme M protein
MSSILNINAPSVEVTIGAVPDGKVIDFLTGHPVLDTPEEYVRQNIEKALVRQYRYDPTICLPEFPIKVGSSRKRVDIVVFESAAVAKSQENAHLLVETKRAGTNPSAKTEGVDQLKSYMATCLNAKYGLWTNGEDRFVFAKRSQNKSLEFEPIVDIPIFGQSEIEAQRPKRKDLMPATADNLLFAFRRCHNYIAGTEGMQKPDAFWELLKLIFCKIEDERSGVLQFYVTPAELSNGFAAAAAKARVQKILEDRVVEKYPAIFVGADRELNLKPNVVAYVVSQLERYSLLASSVDVKGIAYEEVVGSNLRGDRGEFFTPRNACRMAVAMLDPQPAETIIDPACGTGGFLITAMNHALAHLDATERSQWIDPAMPNESERTELFRKRTTYFAQNVSGLDLNPALVRAAKMNMVMNNDGEGGLFQANSLAHPHTWSEHTSKRVVVLPSNLDSQGLVF